MSISLTNKELEALKIINSFVMNTGRMPSIRDLKKEMGYSSPRSASFLIDQLVKKGFLKKRKDGSIQLLESNTVMTPGELTVNIPLLGNVSCGQPIFAEENIEAMIPVSIRLAPPTNKYFLLKARGDSMNLKSIKDGDMVLVKQQATAENGSVVVALIDDSATIKELQKTESAVVLIPRSDNPIHKPIIMTTDFMIQGVVVATIPNVE